MNVTGWTLVVDDDGELMGVEANVELELGDAPAATTVERTLFLEAHEARLEMAVESDSVLRLDVVVDPTRVSVRRDGVGLDFKLELRDGPAIAVSGEALDTLERAARTAIPHIAMPQDRAEVTAILETLRRRRAS